MRLITKKCDRKGFTLLELILVMIILCTVLSMAAPSLRGFFSSREISDTAAKFVAMLRYASTQSISNSNYYRMNFDKQEYQYWLTSLKGSEYEMLEKDMGRKYSISKDIEITLEDWLTDGSIHYVEFTPQGSKTVSKMRLEDGQENMIDILCLSPSEQFMAIEYNPKDEELKYENK